MQAQCNGAAIARLLGVDPETLYRRCQQDHKVDFGEYSAQKKASGQELLRRKQFDTAMAGDKTMLIWLGKQYLGQTDKNETTIKEADLDAAIDRELARIAAASESVIS